MATTAEPAARTLARLYCPDPQRACLGALLDIEAEIRAPLAAGTAHEVAHARLSWWREECARLAAGNPVHPLTRTLAAHLDEAARAALTGLAGLVDLATWDLAAATFETRRELDAYTARWSQALVAPLTSPGLAPAAVARVQLLGSRLHELELLNALAADAVAGRLRLTLQELAAAGVANEEPAGASWSAPLTALVRSRHAEARARLAQAVAALGADEQTALTWLLVWAALVVGRSERVLAALPRARFRAERHAPLDGWRAWRAARRAARGCFQLARH